MKKLLLIIFVTLASISFAQDNQATITINVSNINNDTGQIIALLFSSSDGFPMDSEKAAQIETVQIENGVAIVTFNNISYETYALVVIHDENMNNELNTNFIGKPTEQVWISNDQRGGPFGGPNYDASSIEVNTESTVINARFNY